MWAWIIYQKSASFLSHITSEITSGEHFVILLQIAEMYFCSNTTPNICDMNSVEKSNLSRGQLFKAFDYILKPVKLKNQSGEKEYCPSTNNLVSWRELLLWQKCCQQTSQCDAESSFVQTWLHLKNILIW